MAANNQEKKMTDQEKIKMENQIQHRSETLPTGRKPVDRDKRLVELSFLSEAPYPREYGMEILDHSPGSVELAWMNSGRAPFMVAPNSGEGGHKGAIQIGSIVAGTAVVGADRKTRAVVKISRSKEGDDFLNDYEDDIAINISSGYRQGRPQATKMADGSITKRWMRVEPREVTRVPLPADETVGIGRAADEETTENTTSEDITRMTPEEQRAADLLAAQQTRAVELARLDDIQALGKRFGYEALATRCALEGKSVEETRAALLAELKTKQETTGTTTDADRGDGDGKKADDRIITIHSSVQSFTGTREDAARKAYKFANWFVATVLAGERSFEGRTIVTRAQQYCKDQGIRMIRAERAGQVEGDDSLGGFLVPHEFNNDMIDLRERFGVFRRNVKIVPMSSDTRSQPRRKGGLIAYVIGEGKGATESKKNWDRIGLSAKKIGALTRYSSEIAEDAFVSIGDDLAGEIAYAFSQFEDTVGFTGDGGIDHARIVGAVPSLQNLANAKGVITASGNAWDEFEAIDFLNVIGQLPEYAETGNVKWYCSKLFWATVIQRLKLEMNGNRVSEMEESGRKTFLGYPVEVSQVLPKVAVNDKIQCLFGDLKLAAMMGDRRQTTIRTSEHVHFEEEEIAIAGSQRFDIAVHDIGDATVAGPLLGLKCAAA